MRATIDMRAASLSVNQALFTADLIVEISNLHNLLIERGLLKSMGIVIKKHYQLPMLASEF